MLTRISKIRSAGTYTTASARRCKHAERPRLNVYRSLNHIYVQVIDDLHGNTLVSASSLKAKRKTGYRRQSGCGQECGQDDCGARQGEGCEQGCV